MIRVIGYIGIILATALACANAPKDTWQSDHYVAGEGFVNPEQAPREFTIGRFFTIAKRFLSDASPNTEAFGLIPIQEIPIDALEAQQQDAAYRIGHSTVLLKLSGKYIITDPMFSKRASPVQWLGPERFHPLPIDVNALPKIFAVVISHDHYDHLDQASIEQLAHQVQHFLVPLGVGQYLADWGVPREKIHELDWWQKKQFGGVTFVSTPSQHFSGRGLFNRNQTLWSSWVIRTPEQNIFFSGDSGYFEGFKTIGRQYGPFDLTILENGAYNPDWPYVHMFPAETLQAHQDLAGNAMLPVHNGSFKLAFHPWFEPLEAISSLAKDQGLLVQTPKIGEKLVIQEKKTFPNWWQIPR